MDAKTFQDLFRERDRMLHELALWSEMRDHLAKFLDGDAAPTKVGIVSRGAGGVVPQDVIMEAQLQIDGIVDQLEKGITGIEKIEVAKNEPETKNGEEASEEGKPEEAQSAPRKRGKPSKSTGPGATGPAS